MAEISFATVMLEYCDVVCNVLRVVNHHVGQRSAERPDSLCGLRTRALPHLFADLRRGFALRALKGGFACHACGSF